MSHEFVGGAVGVRRVAALAVLATLLGGAAPPRARADVPRECVTIEDFARARAGGFPPGWQPREDEGKRLYTVVEEPGRRFLRAVVRGFGIQAARPHEWDLAAYPVLTWSWRVREFPRGADERAAATNDSAVAVYMLVAYSRFVGPRALKYVWSEKVPADTHLSSTHGLTQVRVLRSGADRQGEWVEERVDLLADWRKFFKEGGTPRPAGIAVLTDSDDTRSSAQGDYAAFRACRG